MSIHDDLRESQWDASIARGELDMAVAMTRMETLAAVCAFLEIEGYEISAREVREQFNVPRRAA